MVPPSQSLAKDALESAGGVSYVTSKLRLQQGVPDEKSFKPWRVVRGRQGRGHAHRAALG
eukprot:5968910-Amphidinium_carterae.1